jgi:DNA-binding transcriptional MerR regulator
MEPTAPWTLDELTGRVADALSVDYHGQASGRVRDLPDQRAIRWYTTLGLVDRPAAMRGRTALYGPRHLRQLVAIKRLQARGLTLAAVQAELAGAGDADLDRLARIPPAPAPVPMVAGMPAPAGDGGDAGDGATAAKATAAKAMGTTRRFWAASPPPPPSPPSPATGPARAPVESAAHLQGIHLGDEATLLIGARRPVDGEDVRALRAAARPLLEALHARGLAGPGHEPGPGAPDHGRELP